MVISEIKTYLRAKFSNFSIESMRSHEIINEKLETKS